MIKYSLEKTINKNHEIFKKNRKLKFINFFSRFSPIFVSFYGILHYIIEKDLIMTYFSFIIAFLILINYFIFLKIKKSKSSYTLSVSLILAIILLTVEIVKGSFNYATILWIMPFPILAFYLRGKKIGAIYIIIFLSIFSLFIFLNYIFKIMAIYPLDIYLHSIGIYIFISSLTFFYEDTNDKNEKIIIKQLYTDNLTGFPNRSELLNDIYQFSINKENGYLALININSFKNINILYGTKIGDLVLKEISERLQLYKEIQKIYKLNFDEFALIFKNNKSKDNIEYHIKNINQLLIREYNINNNEILLSFTFGLSIITNNVMQNADKALKFAKQKKTNYLFFDAIKDEAENKIDNFIIVKKLREAIVNDDIIPYFQPIYDNKTDKIEKYESLLRIKSKNEILSPLYFLNIAKSSKLYPYIMRIMCLKTFDVFKYSEHNFSLNLSAEDIYNNDSINFIFSLIENYKIASKLTVELVETEEIEQNEYVVDIFKKLKDYGCKIAIDDFGSGYSNFSYILKLNVDYIKIDSSLIMNIDSDINSQIIAETIVDFSKKLNIKTIAEFVHNEKVYDKVKELDIDYSQGYYLGKPDTILEL
ncbi:MAG: EAL domain-containing protein [Spirochaetes bacterium]|nr:EAL domain-containing protein [Spirochaetota bacterium]